MLLGVQLFSNSTFIYTSNYDRMLLICLVGAGVLLGMQLFSNSTFIYMSMYK